MSGRAPRRTALVVVGLVLAFLAPMSAAYALWSRTATATESISVAYRSPDISCGEFDANGKYSITWPNAPGGLTYTVYRSTTTNADASYSSVAAGTTSPYVADIPDGTTFWRVRSTDGTTMSGWSNTLRMVRSGNGQPKITCTGVTP